MDMKTRPAFGKHYLIDLHNCSPEVISHVNLTRDIMMHATKACGATILDDYFHQFEPIGVSGVVLIAESHISVHTWPESAFAAVDIFTSGDMKPQIAVDVIREGFGVDVASMSVNISTRGQLNDD